jgi:hypothetical protein
MMYLHQQWSKFGAVSSNKISNGQWQKITMCGNALWDLEQELVEMVILGGNDNIVMILLA